MATLFLSVFDAASNALVAPASEFLTITVGGASAQSSVLTGPTKPVQKLVRMFTDTDCFVHWGADPTATSNGSSGMPLGAENPEVVTVDTGQKFACIERT